MLGVKGKFVCFKSEIIYPSSFFSQKDHMLHISLVQKELMSSNEGYHLFCHM